MVGGVLGFDTNTKKSDVGNYFKKIQETVQGTKDKLNKIVADMKSENNPNASITETAVNKLVSETLSKIIDGAKIASEAIGSDNNPIANVATAGNDAAAGGVKGDGIENLVKGIKDLVEVILGDKGNAEAGDANKASDGGSRTANAADGEAGKLFATGNGPAGDQNNSKKVATDAAKAVGAVTGADILQAMVKDGGAATLAKNSAEQVAGANAKDSVIAGGIVLRAIAKGGKFANGNNAGNADVATVIKGAAISAVTKALGTLTIAIRNTIDVGLKEVKGAIKINATDTPVTTDNQTPETKS
ncbi:variable large family protein (plasmid) [Borrelia turicatae 91E135]|uniref:Variable large protein n=1 Tax=Borrelia turicatae (strain 91E135) TaxID=314724 RepID=A0ABF7R057_BORT9|nr:VlpC1 [Borrelia turicatae 91E135]UPA14359.1 variable large family protein [Borrelia turicatae 91E135]